MAFFNNRRQFIQYTTKFTIGGALFGLLGHTHAKAETQSLYKVDLQTEGKCITCEFWGGMRKVSKESKTIIAQSVGWCNNPKSGHYQSLTAPDTGPMKAWQQWRVLEKAD